MSKDVVAFCMQISSEKDELNSQTNIKVRTESAKSAKPILALNGVGDGSLWVAEYLTNNERISN